MSVERTTAAGGMETSYGFKRVGEGEKQSLVNDVFHKVANRYDLIVHIGSLPDSSMVAYPIAPNSRFLCAAPRYLAHIEAKGRKR